MTADLVGRRIGKYRVDALIGRGGMGEVYKAHDTKLDRPVAIKLLPPQLSGDEDRMRRFRAEARNASALNHPNILVVHDFGEHDGRPLIVTEFVEGVTLRERMAAGPLTVQEILDVAVQVASALAATHDRGVVHRDIKPENVMLRPDGFVKVLDFGLAKLMTTSDQTATMLETTPGAVLGTPRYMSPEQARGHETDGRTDIWSLGVVLYEMTAGAPPFDGATPSDAVAAILRDDPVPLDRRATGIPAGLADVVAKALAKDPAGRFPSPRAMFQALSNIRAETPAPAVGARLGAADRIRLMVLPFRIHRADPDVDFLAFGLPDAITSSLSAVRSIVVRSSLVAARFAGDSPDFVRIARDADVSAVVAGVIVRSGDRVRVTAQLVETPGGAVLWSSTSEAPMGDLFQLQDVLVTRIVESMQTPLSIREQRALNHDVPADPRAYEWYLRANELSRQPAEFEVAKQLYMKCVAADPAFAPAWARLGRLHRVIGKFNGDPSGVERAEHALARALALNPDLSVAHNYYAYLDIDRGRAVDAMVRLTKRAAQQSNEAELFAGLVQACRYCGLLDASVAAHRHAHALDPLIATGVVQSLWMRGDIEGALTECDRTSPIGSLRSIVLALAGREAEAIADLRDQEAKMPQSAVRYPTIALLALLEGNRAAAIEATEHFFLHGDPEALYFAARYLARLDETDRAAATVASALAKGFNTFRVMTSDPWIASLRGHPTFERARGEAEKGYRAAARAFVDAGGERVLGTGSAA